MNKKCDNRNCIYYNTCLIDNFKREVKCTGKLSIKNPQHPNYHATIRGNDEGKE